MMLILRSLPTASYAGEGTPLLVIGVEGFMRINHAVPAGSEVGENGTGGSMSQDRWCYFLICSERSSQC